MDVHEVVQAHRRYLVQLMQEWTRLKEYAADRDLGFGLAVDAELFRLDAVVRWLDAADGRIKRASLELPDGPRRSAAEAATTGGGAAMSVLELRGGVEGVRRRAGRGPRPRGRVVDRRTRASWSRSWDRAGPARARC